MNTAVSVASLASATALPSPSIAGQMISADKPGELSFPHLVARFMRVRERWAKQRELDKISDKIIFDALFKATGVTREAWGAMETTDPGFKAALDALHKAIAENPDDDPVDEHGASIAWNEIHDELLPLAEEMLGRMPRSVADLAWQAYALVTADPDLREGEGDIPDGRLVRKLIGNIRALAGNLQMPAGATAQPVGASDLRLAQIEAKVRNLRAAADDLDGPYMEAEEAFKEWEEQNPMPDLPQATLSPAIEEKLCSVTSVTVRDLKAIRMAMKLFFGEEEAAALLDQRATATVEWSKRREAALSVRRDKQAPYFELQSQVYDLCTEAATIRATTLAALQTKGRIRDIASRMDDEHMELSASVHKELLALQSA